ncbi:hypothetical protein [Silanimonas sp.]|uniref:hypothetical protein n=1 Tax=Silanimonas sp. TaxID=1929290 RepID=UPI001BB9D00D|nr:hypothetical protein [Silanimonas sp.]MBS3896324.1 hypothetical protein [Silanimonas sp.]MBS3923753.1 hypothetical protein [Xanthomonadaceae bacterium]
MVRLLKALGYTPDPQRATSHQHWRLLDSEGRLRCKVTLDEHLEPYAGDLLKNLMNQMKLSKREFHAALAAM